MPISPADYQAKVDKSVIDMDRFDAIVNGGPTTDVSVDSGSVPSVAKVLAVLEAVEETASASAASSATSAAEAAGYRDETQTIYDAAALLTAIKGGFATRPAATTAIGGFATGDIVLIAQDASYGDRPTLNEKSGGAWVFRSYLFGSGTAFYVDPVDGNDGNSGTLASPFATFTHAISVSSEGDAIIGKPRIGTTAVKEDVDAGAYNNRTFAAPGYVFQAYDAFTGAWTETSAGSGIWKATINHLFGGVGVRDATQPGKVYSGLFGDKTPYRLAGEAPANEAAAIAALGATGEQSYIVLGPIVDGAQSSNAHGWEQANHDYYARPPAGVNPSTMAWRVQQRTQPVFGHGWTLYPFDVFGGRSHNGAVFPGADLRGRVSIWYPSNHGCFLPGAQGIGPIVRGRNPNGAAGFAFHNFNGGARLRATILNNPQAYGYNEGFDNLFGGHGAGQGNDIIERLEVNDLYAENITAIGCSGETTWGNVFRRPRVYGCRETSFSIDNVDVYDPEIVHVGTAGSCWQLPVPGKSVRVFGGTSAGSPETLWFNGYSASGTLGSVLFDNHKAIAAGDRINARWWSSTAHSGVTFQNGCIIQGEGASDIAFTWGQVSDGSAVAFADSALIGVTPPTGATFTRSQKGGFGGLLRGPKGQVIAHDDRKLDQALGTALMGVAWPQQTGGANYQNGYVLASDGFHRVGGATQGWEQPIWTAVNGYTITGLTVASADFQWPWVIAYGPNSTVLIWQVTAADNAAPTVVDTSAVAGKTITGAVTSHADGKCWLGCSDGTIIEIDAAAGTATARASGVAFPLTGGSRNGSTIIMVGCNAGGTAGGIVRSTDGGATWATVLDAASSSPAGIGDLAKTLRSAAFVNGIYVAMGNSGTFITSPTAASGAWTARTLGVGVSVRTIAEDRTNKRLMWGGDGTAGVTGHGALLGVIDAHDADPANWTGRTIVSPVSAVGANLVAAPLVSLGAGTQAQWVVIGQVAQVAIAEDPLGAWRRSDWPRPSRSFAHDDAGLAAMLSLA